EVLGRGGVIFQGYFNDQAKTDEALVNGWFHTGDIGEISDDGYLRIVDRKKELIITSGGKNISPGNLEAALRGIDLIGQAAVIGDNRKYLSALLVLDPEAAKLWASRHGVDVAAMADDPRVIAEVQAGVDRINTQFAKVEQIKKFTLLADEWQPDSEVLTPTSKLKRRGINAVYAEQIEAMYVGA
ncbi:MAG TPA: AMP-binding protein, partial [Ilumatobacteraceae bacterium]|nr:AMP-binding protein [Ilumatobacteraceae bacterium]